MHSESPKVVILAGPNGAGKSTSAPRLLRGALKVEEFVNADTIAQGLSAFWQERVAFQAGRIMLKRLSDLASARTTFGFETTLATRSYAVWLKRLQASGYEVHLMFLWLPSADMAVARVADRVRLGGHNVPEDTVRRRYAAGLTNLRQMYLSLADSWKVIDNTHIEHPRVIAAGFAGQSADIYLDTIWNGIIDGGATMSTTNSHDQLAQLRAEVAVVEAAMQEAARDALLAHKRTGLPVVIWQNGKVVWVPADQIPFDDAPPSH